LIEDHATEYDPKAVRFDDVDQKVDGRSRLTRDARSSNERRPLDKVRRSDPSRREGVSHAGEPTLEHGREHVCVMFAADEHARASARPASIRRRQYASSMYLYG
jgi:hypothetical protein